MTPCPSPRRRYRKLLRHSDAPGRMPVSRSRRAALSLLAVMTLVGAGCGAGPEPESQPQPQHVSQPELRPQPRPEPQERPDLSFYDYAGFDTVPVPEPFASICVRPRRLVGEWIDTIIGPGTRVPKLAEFERSDRKFDTPLRCVARTAEEKRVLLQGTPLADSARWYDPNWMVLLAAHGHAPHSGRGVRIEFVTQDGDSLVTHVVKFDGGSWCPVQYEASYPIGVMAIPTSDGKVVFREHVKLRPPCF